jgi:4-hydroxy-4-methyl-2-oxoglutarate aldolase
MFRPVAVKNIERADVDIISGLGEMGVATVHEAQGRVGLLHRAIRPVYRGPRISGSAVTILTQPGDNWMVHVAIELCKPGDILVIACTADNTDGMFGDLLATSAKAHGIIGMVSDTGVRDSADFPIMEFPVWSRAVHAKGTVKETVGSVNVPIVCAGQSITPGDIIVADDDGVVVVERLQGATVLKNAHKRIDNEDEKRQRMARGEPSLDIYSMRPRLAEAGLVYVDSLSDLEKLK